MKTLTMKEIEIGMRVVFVDRSLNCDGCHVDSTRKSVPLDGREGIIVATSDAPGKAITVVLADEHPMAHTCDGFAPDKHGVWALPEQLYTPEAHAEHKAESERAHAANAERDEKRAKALELGNGFLKK